MHLKELPPLVPDVFPLIFSHLPQSDVARIMLVSKSFYALGLIPLLRPGVDIKHRSSLLSFCRFILNDVSARAPHVRRLHLCMEFDTSYRESDSEADADEEGDGPESVDTCLSLLAQVLRHTLQLRDLRIDFCEPLLEREESLSAAVISLPNLHCLDVSDMGDLTVTMIDKLESSLIDVNADCYDLYDDPLVLLRRHQSTLEKLTLHSTEARDRTLQFTHLRALVLRRFAGLDVSVLIHAFPNLMYLDLPEAEDEETEDIVTLREENKGHNLRASWKHLDHVCGCLRAMYALGLACHVKRVDIDYLYPDPDDLDQLNALVADASPSHLLVRTSHEALELPELLGIPEASGITHLLLDIRLLVSKSSGKSFIAGLAKLMRKLSVRFLVLRLNEYEESDERAQRDAPDSRIGRGIWNTFQPPHHDAIVNKIAIASHALEHLSLDIMGQKPKYWSIKREGLTLAVKELDPALGRELRGTEGLAFNDRRDPWCD